MATRQGFAPFDTAIGPFGIAWGERGVVGTQLPEASEPATRARLGETGAAQAVGQALGRNPFAIVVPCHRVLAAGGKLGGFSADGGVTTKRRLLTIEGARAIHPGLFND
jgi:O-6-methylguanine DNA methyltransferase